MEASDRPGVIECAQQNGGHQWKEPRREEEVLVAGVSVPPGWVVQCGSCEVTAHGFTVEEALEEAVRLDRANRAGRPGGETGW